MAAGRDIRPPPEPTPPQTAGRGLATGMAGSGFEMVDLRLAPFLPAGRSDFSQIEPAFSKPPITQQAAGMIRELAWQQAAAGGFDRAVRPGPRAITQPPVKQPAAASAAPGSAEVRPTNLSLAGPQPMGAPRIGPPPPSLANLRKHSSNPEPVQSTAWQAEPASVHSAEPSPPHQPAARLPVASAMPSPVIVPAVPLAGSLPMSSQMPGLVATIGGAAGGWCVPAPLLTGNGLPLDPTHGRFASTTAQVPCSVERDAACSLPPHDGTLRHGHWPEPPQASVAVAAPSETVPPGSPGKRKRSSDDFAADLSTELPAVGGFRPSCQVGSTYNQQGTRFGYGPLTNEEMSAAAADALRTAAEEGLEVERSRHNATGFTGVKRSVTKRQRSGRRFEAQIGNGRNVRYLGTHDTAEQAALAVARARAESAREIETRRAKISGGPAAGGKLVSVAQGEN